MLIKKLYQQTHLENLRAAAAADNYLSRLISYFIIIHIIYTIATFFEYANNDISWIVELCSFALRIMLWLVIPLLLFPQRKELWLIMIASFINLPSSISDIEFVDEYDNLFIFLKLLVLIPAGYLTIRSLFIGGKGENI